MTAVSTDLPELYWISGSPPAWRVLLGLALKQIPYLSRRLDPSRGEHKSKDYLLLNPRGQVPTLVFEGSAIRESIAILAFLDARWPSRPLFGGPPSRAGAIWQAVIEAETALHTPLRVVAQVLFRGQSKERMEELTNSAALAEQELEHWERKLERNDFAVDSEPTAADCVLYPSVAWLCRAIEKSAHDDEVPARVTKLLDDYSQIGLWRRRMQALPGFEATYPPHWREATSSVVTSNSHV